MTHEATALLFRIRCLLGLFIAGLVVSGITAFPLVSELDLLARLLGISARDLPEAADGLRFWIATVQHALHATGERYPFLAYGTDWLAFGHLVIALFFGPVFRNPLRYRANLICGLIACVGVVPLAIICGAIRGIPFYWRLIDCSFGVSGFVLLSYILRLVRTLPLEDSHQPAAR